MSEEFSHDSVERVAHWFIAIAGVVYGTGFVTVFTFLNRFGVTEEGSEVFKAKYIFVGVLHLLLPVIIGVPVAVLFHIRGGGSQQSQAQQTEQSQVQQAERPHFYLSSILIIANLLFVFYVYVLFAPPGFLERREFVVPLLFLWTFILLRIVRRYDKTIEKFLDVLAIALHPPETEKWKQKKIDDIRSFLRWVLCVVFMLPAGYISLRGIFRFLGKILWNGGGSGAYVLLLLVGLMGWLVLVTINQMQTMPKWRRLAVGTIVACLVGALYYFSVLIFAIRVYPYIPAVRGGGDYSESPKVLLHFKKDNLASLPPGILASGGDGLTSEERVILEITSSSILAVDPREAGGPKCWRGPNRPKIRITEIRRDDVESIAYSNVKEPTGPLFLPVCSEQYTSAKLGECCPAD